MPELKLGTNERRDRIDVLTLWLPRVAVGAVFLSIGAGKFTADAGWVRLFDEIGIGQWFRYATGILQMLGAVLVLIPRVFLLGVVILGCTMAGAMATWVLVLDAPANALSSGVILGALLAVGVHGYISRGAR